MTYDPRAYQAEYKRANAERLAEYQRAYYQKNKEAIKERARASYQADPDPKKANNKSYAEANRESVQAARKRYWHGARKHKERAISLTPSGRAKKILVRCRSMARPRGLEFAISIDDILPALESGKCVVTGIPFDMESIDGPWRPSIDRIDSSRGYIPGNVQIVVWMYNAAKQQYSAGDVLTLALALMSRQTETQGAAS